MNRKGKEKNNKKKERKHITPQPPARGPHAPAAFSDTRSFLSLKRYIVTQSCTYVVLEKLSI
jgi:hypothetical protein